MTRAYYNENDEFAADWLRNLIEAGLIADGEVDTRSIVDVRPDDLRGFQQCHFFAGIGGWSYALRKAGWDDSRPAWTGSCPCQPFSLAGAQRGFADERHLWPVWRDLIRECEPAIVFGEQVASATDWLRLVRGDLEALGYAVGAMPVQAASAGADHLRDRYWFVADDGAGRRAGPGWRQGEQPGRAKAVGPSDAGIGLADANNARPQGRQLLPERVGERVAGADGVADADQPGASEERQQRGGQLSGAGGDPEACAGGGSLADTSNAQPQEREGNDGIDGQRPALRGREFEPSSAGAGGRTDDRSNATRDDRSRLAREDSGDGAIEWVIGADGKARRVKSGIRLLADGVPNRVGLLRGFGNAIDPRPAAAFITAAMAALSPHHRRES